MITMEIELIQHLYILKIIKMLLFIILNSFISFLFIGSFGRFFGSFGTRFFAVTNISFNLFIIFVTFNQILFTTNIYTINIGNWISSGIFNVDWAFIIDDLTIIMLIVVNFISTLVHLYSCEYMNKDPHISRFMSYLTLFTFFMVILITADTFIQLFLGWEGVGLCSYLLINFWYTRIQANKSALKAIIVNRISDFGLTFGMILLFYVFTTTDFILPMVLQIFFINQIFFIFNNNIFFYVLSLITFFLFIGAVGKSAQIFLHTWLPDAMEGPTPVSALIHAATMVTAGVFLIIKCSNLYEFSYSSLFIITFCGTITSIFAATSGLFLSDIKKVIAYSTCSQLGYMILICGFSSYNLSLFHLFNHALFKAALFLCAGAIIHSLSNEQDMRRMGGLINLLPISYIVMFIASLAIIGFPFLTGFFSKDIIFEITFNNYGSAYTFIYWIISLTAVCTTIYSFRILYLVFFNISNSFKIYLVNIHESSYLMSSVLCILAMGSIFSGYCFKDLIIGFGNTFLTNNINHFLLLINLTDSEFIPCLIKNIPIFLGLCGISLFFIFQNFARKYIFFYTKFWNTLYNFFLNKWYFDYIYNFYINIYIFIKSKNWIYKLLDKGILEIYGPFGFWKLFKNLQQFLIRFQTGNITLYLYFFGFFILILVYLIKIDYFFNLAFFPFFLINNINKFKTNLILKWNKNKPSMQLKKIYPNYQENLKDAREDIFLRLKLFYKNIPIYLKFFKTNLKEFIFNLPMYWKKSKNLINSIKIGIINIYNIIPKSRKNWKILIIQIYDCIPKSRQECYDLYNFLYYTNDYFIFLRFLWQKFSSFCHLFFLQNRFLYWNVKIAIITEYKLNMRNFYIEETTDYWLLIQEIGSYVEWLLPTQRKKQHWELWSPLLTYELLCITSFWIFCWKYWPKLTICLYIIFSSLVLFSISVIFFTLYTQYIQYYYFILWYLWLDMLKIVNVEDSDCFFIFLIFWAISYAGIFYTIITKGINWYHELFYYLRLDSRFNYIKQDYILNSFIIIFSFIIFFFFILTGNLFWDFAQRCCYDLAGAQFVFDPMNMELTWIDMTDTSHIQYRAVIKFPTWQHYYWIMSDYERKFKPWWLYFPSDLPDIFRYNGEHFTYYLAWKPTLWKPHLPSSSLVIDLIMTPESFIYTHADFSKWTLIPLETWELKTPLKRFHTIEALHCIITDRFVQSSLLILFILKARSPEAGPSMLIYRLFTTLIFGFVFFHICTYYIPIFFTILDLYLFIIILHFEFLWLIEYPLFLPIKNIYYPLWKMRFQSFLENIFNQTIIFLINNLPYYFFYGFLKNILNIYLKYFNIFVWKIRLHTWLINFLYFWKYDRPLYIILFKNKFNNIFNLFLNIMVEKINQYLKKKQ